MKVTGAELIKFFEEGWPTHEKEISDYEFYLDGELEIDDINPINKYDIDDLGCFSWNGPRETDPTDGDGIEFSASFKSWRKTKTHTTICFSVKNDAVSDLLSYAKSIGAKKV